MLPGGGSSGDLFGDVQGIVLGVLHCLFGRFYHAAFIGLYMFVM